MKKKLVFLLLLFSGLSISSCSRLALLNKEPETVEDYKFYGKKYEGVVDAVKFCHKNEENFEALLEYQKDHFYAQRRDSYTRYYGDRDILADIDAIVDLVTEYKKLRGQITIEEIKKDDKMYMRVRYSSDFYSKLSDHAEYCDNLYKYTENLEEFFKKKSLKKNLIKSEYLEGVSYLKKLSNIPEVQEAIIDDYRTLQKDKSGLDTSGSVKYNPIDTSIDYTQYSGFRPVKEIEKWYKYCTYEYNGLNADTLCYDDGVADIKANYKVYSKLGKLTAKEAKVFNENRASYIKKIADIEKDKSKIYDYEERIESLNQSINFLIFVEGKIKYLRFTNKIEDYYSGNFHPFSYSKRDSFEEKIRRSLK